MFAQQSCHFRLGAGLSWTYIISHIVASVCSVCRLYFVNLLSQQKKNSSQYLPTRLSRGVMNWQADINTNRDMNPGCFKT